MDLLIPALVQLALLVAGAKLYLWSRRRAKASRTRWRRRIGALLFFLPAVLFLSEHLLPQGLQAPVRAVSLLNGWVDRGLAWTIGKAQGQLSGVWALAVKPLVLILFYTVAGVLVGWPLDRLARARAGEEQPDA